MALLDPIPYRIIGKIVDNSNNPLSGATIISSKGDTTTSEVNGDFELNGLREETETFSIIISNPGFGEKTVIPFNLGGDVRNNGNVGIIILEPNIFDLEDSIRQEIITPDAQVKTLELSKTDFEMAKQQAINKLITQIKTVLVPQILTLIAAFGISKAKDALGKKFGDMNATCPANLDELNALIKRKNKLTKSLNNIFNFLTTLKVGVEFIDKTISVSQITVEVLNNLYLAFPVAGFGAPDVSKPIKEIIDKIREKLQQYKLISSTTLLVLTILIQILQQVLNYLSLLDSVIQGCAIEGQLPQEQLTEELFNITKEQEEQGQSIDRTVNGFTLSVIPSESTTNYSLKRRQAIAKNPSGIIMLRGEESFSSDDQILINELAFYIKQNNLSIDGIASSVTPQTTQGNQTTSVTSTPVSSGTGGSIGGGGGGGGY